MDLLFPLLIVALLVPLFLNARRQKKVVAQTTAMQDSLKAGDEVVTTAGLYARVVLVEDETVDLEISDGIITTWSRSIVREILADENELDGDIDDVTGEVNVPTATAGPSLTKDETLEQSAKRLEKE